MVVTPVARPVTTPADVTVAIPVLALLHVPPVVASVSVVEEPLQVVGLPDIAAGNGLTLTFAVLIHPLGAV